MIGMYAHHTGNGHLHRVRAIQKHLGDRAVVFSSVPWADITLPLDPTGGFIHRWDLPLGAGRGQWTQ